MLKFVRISLLVLSIVFISWINVDATHLRAGDITVTRYSCSDYRYKITLHIYTRASSTVKFGGGNLGFGDGTSATTPVGQFNNPPIISPVDGGVGDIEFSIDHRFPGPGVYTITYYEQNRNGGIANLGGGGSDQIPFFIQTQIVIDDFLGCDNSPQLLVPPIDLGCTGVAWFHNPGAYDPDGDSLSYELYVPKQGAVYDVDGQYISSVDANYISPAAPNFSHARESTPGAPIFEIDHVTGTIKWDAPGTAGEYNIAFIIRQWRKIGDTWVSLGYVERDMQVIIQSCQNNRPKIQVPPDVCVNAGDLVTGDVFATDPAVNPGNRTSQDGNSVMIEAFSQVFSINPSPATYTPFPVVWQPTTTDVQQAHLKFTWQTECAHIKEQPYEVVFKATDNGSPNLATFETWKIKVVAPPPLLISAGLVTGTRYARLRWSKYTCHNAAYIQIWRRVDSAPFTPPPCVTGMPDFLGYNLIDQVSIDSISYTDKHLASGAKYCYRIVAIFPKPDGGESYVSQEVCMNPIKSDGPVITNVTIDVTDDNTVTHTGQITVKWKPPFESIKTGPYSYEVYRAEGVSGNINSIKVSVGKIPDTMFVDVGLNTAQIIYNYKVKAFDSNGDSIATSPSASSVRLNLKPLFQRVELNWNASVPWSNNTVLYPYHLIYRGTGTGSKTISDLVLIDSVNVNQYQFAYTDSGQYHNTPLVPTQDYCYAVMTRGSYGNPLIISPLINFSEITCTVPDNQTKPCVPVLSVRGIDCRNFNNCPVIGSSTFSNTIKWKRPTDPNCRKEIKGYYVYFANAVGDSFTRIPGVGLVTDTFYVHNNLQSFAQCYKISAVSRADIESDLSDQFCFDNCPYYELPNVFTPDGDGCNDTFSAFSIRSYGDDGWPCGHNYFKPGTQILDTLRNDKSDSVHFENIKNRCARFVSAVDLTVYNRWGKEVYKYQSGGENTIYIDWNGKDNNGRDLDAGVYYYIAGVVFDVVDPKKRNQTIKGWVQIYR